MGVRIIFIMLRTEVYMAAEHQAFSMSCQNKNCFLEHDFFCHHPEGLRVSTETSNLHLQTAEKNALYSKAL